MKKIPKFSSRKRYNKIHEKALYLINDEYNTFEYVVDCLVTMCDHDEIQAEQCTLLTHYRGCCEIAVGNEIDLLLLKEDLIFYGLNVEIR